MGRVSLAELKRAGVAIRADEAAAIVLVVCRRYSAGAIHGIPDPREIFLSSDGAIAIDGDVKADAAPIPAAAALVEDLAVEMPGALRLVLARAAGSLDVPPFSSLDEFATALERFATASGGDAAKMLYASGRRVRRGPGAARYAWLAAAAALVLILVGLLVIPSRAPEPRHLAAGDTPPPLPPVAEGTTGSSGPERSAAPAKPVVKKVVKREPARQQPARKSLFKRELFRIVIK